jgi:hypothetical protein
MIIIIMRWDRLPTAAYPTSICSKFNLYSSYQRDQIHQSRPSIFDDLIGRYSQMVAVEFQPFAFEFISPQGGFRCIFLLIGNIHQGCY